ncbi:MAG: TonB-dependent receptor [Bacteroidales bacterium]|nr:TonB-dependent receptor [Bacteroidales bacterium]
MRKIASLLAIVVWVTGLMAQPSNAPDLMALAEPGTSGSSDGEPAAAGIIRGKILDATTGEALIGANVFLSGTTTGTITDFDGNFTLTNVTPGVVSVTASYISYETQVFNGVVVPAGKVVILNANLDLSSQQIEEVVVKARKREQTEAAVLVMKKRMPTVLDGISSQQISRLGDSDAASALKRVTGVSVQGGKYVYVRGLSDRYSNTTLNGAQIPGLDPERNTVQMDLFPSNIIENLIVFKTFSPDLPGNSTGGLVNIVTKDFPERFNLQFSAALGYNSQAHLRNDFLSYKGGSTDWLGMDDGTRSVPGEVDELTESGQLPYIYTGADETLGVISRGFNKSMDNTTSSSFLDQSYSFSVGNRVSLFNRDLGFNLSASYSRDYEMYTGGRDEKYSVTAPDEPAPKRLVEDNMGTESAIWSGLANLSYKINNNNMIGFTVMRNQSGVKSSRYNIGVAADPDQEDIIEQKLGWLERSIASFQARGKHVFPGLNNATIDWMGSYTMATQDEPDLRFFFMDYDTDESSGEYNNYVVRLNNLPARFYREMSETNTDVKLNYTQPFRMAGRNAKLKFGGSYVEKNRLSVENKFDVKRQGGIQFDGTAADFLRDENIVDGPGQYNMVYYANSNLTDHKNSYDGSESVVGAYGMVDLSVSEQVRLVTGLRYELSEVFVENHVDTIEYPTKGDDYDNGGFMDNDFLPSLNLVYSPFEDMNFRVGYGRTVARPVFRELAPYASYDYKAGLRKIGNPKLAKTTVDNVDFRWDWFARPGEILSVSAFYKYFTNPIELRDKEQAANPEIHYENIDNSTLYGLEFEFRKRLDMVEALRNFSLGANVTLVKSIVKEDSTRLASARLVDPDWAETRPMFGQSPYVINSYLNYHNFEKGWDINLGYNVSGEKLILVNKAATPDVYEQPFPMLDFNISKQFKNNINVKFSADNLLNPDFEQTYDFGSSTGYFRKFKMGRSFSLSLTYLIH